MSLFFVVLALLLLVLVMPVDTILCVNDLLAVCALYTLTPLQVAASAIAILQRS